mmetsp:Transcript_81686/g.179522  ORF Transcript_81686/g.179522 Transcript_81686/m.179522 type:complete len:132 (-) Transcript_81686:507-902(-)
MHSLLAGTTWKMSTFLNKHHKACQQRVNSFVKAGRCQGTCRLEFCLVGHKVGHLHTPLVMHHPEEIVPEEKLEGDCSQISSNLGSQLLDALEWGAKRCASSDHSDASKTDRMPRKSLCLPTVAPHRKIHEL